jgi:hypothetical protein
MRERQRSNRPVYLQRIYCPCLLKVGNRNRTESIDDIDESDLKTGFENSRLAPWADRLEDDSDSGLRVRPILIPQDEIIRI